MFKTFFTFELKSLLRAPMPWIFLFVFALIVFGATVSDNVQIGGSYGNIWKNAPFVVQNFYAIVSVFFGLILTTAFMNIASLRDFENNTSQIIFASPIQKAGYFFGHFFGAVLVAMVPMLGVSLGVFVGTLANGIFHWIEPERFGPLSFNGHFQAILMFVLPNILFAGSIVYSISILTKKTTYAYVATLALLVAYIASGTLLRDLNNENLAMMLDPFGIRTFNVLTKYWTVEEKNTQTLAMSGMMLWNRLLWSAVGIGILFLSYLKFSFSEKSEKIKKDLAKEEDKSLVFSQLSDYPRISPDSGMATRWSQFWTQFKTDFKGIVRSTPFFLLVIIGLLNMIPAMMSADDSYGGKILPVTYQVIDGIRGSFYLYLISMMSYFTGILVWKERNAKVNEIYDTLPTKNWTIWLAKFAAMASTVLILLCMTIGVGIFTQVMKGYSGIELNVYFSELLLEDYIGFLGTIAICLLIQTLSPNMYLGFFIVVIFNILNAFVWSAMHIETNMVRFGATPSHIYSDLYGYAPYLKGKIWFNTYWTLFSALLAIVSMLFWVRGKDSDWKNRFRLAKIEWKGYKTAGLALLALWLGTAGFVYYNTQVLNTYKTSKEAEKAQVAYEKGFKKYDKMPQPRVFDVKLNIAIFPENRSVNVKGDYWVKNNNAKAIDTLFVNVPQHGNFSLSHERLSSIFQSENKLVRFYKFSPALAVGDSVKLQFEMNFQPKGFENQVEFKEVVQNGTFFNNSEFIPLFGYEPRYEISSKNDRKTYGLPEKSRSPALNRDDLENRKNAYIANNADLINLETTISTSDDQMAIAPGSLIKSWKSDHRNYYTYKLDHASANFSAFISAKYEVAKRDWNGISLEVYYDKKHAYNVDRMLNSIQKSLEYYTKNFGPYTHKQCRIIEFPRFERFAQCFPGTMPYSEAIGFVADFSDPEAIDKVFYVVAHEMAHQWWAHQECGAKMQGGEMTVETFAQYSALMVMEKEYGRDAMRKFLEYEMDDYLRGRGRESLKELPLYKCESQNYIHYQKGSVVMYNLKEMIGEEKVNIALRAFLEKFKYKGAPYPTSLDAIDEFEKQTPDSLKYIIKDMFYDITLFDNKTKEVSSKKLDNGKYEVTIQVESIKYKADELGKETEIPVNDYMEIGAFAKPEKDKKYGKTLYRKLVRINKKDNSFTFIVDEAPDKAGIDPFSLLIDRMPKDNLKEVKGE